MKVIAMMPVRNEAQLLPMSLGCLAGFCDRILVLIDVQSTDDSLAIAKSFAKVDVLINETASGASVAAGALVAGRSLLFEAFRSYDGCNLGLCVDADEVTPPRIFSKFAQTVAAFDRPGAVFSLWWVQLWKSIDFYRADDSVWSNSWKPMAFHDDRHLFYPKDQPHFHESRTPRSGSDPVRLEGFPVIHLQWAAWQRTQYKQASLRVFEYIGAGFRGASEINARYAVTLGDEREGVKPVEPDWLEEVSIPADYLAPLPSWHRDRVLALFDTHGIQKFEPLQIWHIPEFHERFQSAVGRPPRPAVYGPLALFARQMARLALPASARTLIKRAARGRAPGTA
jgi:hypothetical protein